jgi:glucosylceramidase
LQHATIPDSRTIIRSLVTHDEKRLALLEEVEMRPQNGTVSEAIAVDSGETYQSILGFGAALTDAACFLIDRLEAGKKEEFLGSVFSRAGLRLNCCRICMGSSDYATKAYSYADQGPDPELKGFNVEHDRAYIVPIIREAKRLNPELFLLASPWSPPGWMKAGGSMLGGSMRREHLAAYADYFDKFLDAYKEMGIHVGAVSVQNEVDTDQEGLMPACIWTQST